jgi:hypothetical protein
VLSLIRRAEQAAYEYGQGRAALVGFMEQRANQNDHLHVYACALSHFEQCIIQASLAVSVVRTMIGKDLYKRADGSDLERLNEHLYNRIKHFAGVVGIFPSKGKLYDNASVTAPIWITDEGLESSEGMLTWTEIKELLDEILRVAEELATVPTPMCPPNTDVTISAI